MSHSHQHTNLHDHVPYHKLTEAQGRAWCFLGARGDQIRRSMASQLAKMYPSGVGLCSSTMKLVAYIEPSGRFRMLVAPFKTIPISAIANKPRERECPCQQFFDPEIKGPWKDRSNGKHHPFCQYEKDAARVFTEVYKAKHGGVIIDSKGVAHRERGRGPNHTQRPDLMLKVQQEIKGR